MRTRSTPTRTAALLLLLSLAVACRDELPTAAPLAAGPLATLGVAPAAVPAPPANLGAYREGPPLRINLSWTDASSDETSFRVRRSTRATDGTFPPSQLIATLPAGVAAYLDWEVSGGTYRYQVQACNASGCAASTGAIVGVPAFPVAPAGLTATALAGPRVQLAWTNIITNAQFTVRRATRQPGGGFGAFNAIATVRAGSTGYDDRSVQIGQVYAYRVVACNVSGCAHAAFPPPVTILPPPAAPTSISASPISPWRVDVSWTHASSNETAFRVLRSTRQVNGRFTVFQEIARVAAGVSLFSDLTVVRGRTYRYRVEACRNTTCVSSDQAFVAVPAP